MNDGVAGVIPLADGFLALLADGVHHRAARYTHQGRPGENAFTRKWLTGTHASNLFGLATTDGKTILYGHSTASSPTQWYHVRLDGTRLHGEKAIAGANEHLENRRKARMEVIHWKGGLGEEVEGLLFYPHEYKQGTRAPLVVQIHGGPASADLDAWSDRWSYCAEPAVPARGLCPQAELPRQHQLRAEVDGVDHGRQVLRTGAGGRRKGRGRPHRPRTGRSGPAGAARLVQRRAILTNVLITRSTRFKAAVAGAGTVEYISDWASCEFGEAFDRYYLARSPLEDLDLYLRKSPFHHFDKVRTPTLIFFGTEDRIVHPQQGWAQYRALQQLGKTPVRFVQFPGEKHSLKKLSHQRRKLQEELAWFDRYLFGKARPGDEVVKDVKEDSPLAWALKRQAAKKIDSRFGILLNGVLAPETVKHAALRVGRFEVTRAQYAAFDKNYAVEAGKENYPASGVTFEQASAYCVWLSKQTGKKYHLPSEREADALYEKSETGENTLDYWAGYTVNPDDALKPREKLKGLSGTAAVARGSGPRPGNRQSGTGVRPGRQRGGVGVRQGRQGSAARRHADTPADTRGGALKAGPEYRGFRVVRD